MDGHTKICRHHGTDFIGCRRDKGGASIGTGAMRDRSYVVCCIMRTMAPMARLIIFIHGTSL